MAKKTSDQQQVTMPLGKENYVLLLIGFAVIITGFILMSGGKSNDPNVFNEEIFSFRRIVLAPMIVLAGFLFEIYAIMKRPKNDEGQVNQEI